MVIIEIGGAPATLKASHLEAICQISYEVGRKNLFHPRHPCSYLKASGEHNPSPPSI